MAVKLIVPTRTDTKPAYSPLSYEEQEKNREHKEYEVQSQQQISPFLYSQSMTVSQYTENICVSTNSLMKGRSLALKDSTKESFMSKLTLSGVCTSVMACKCSLAHKPPR